MLISRIFVKDSDTLCENDGNVVAIAQCGKVKQQLYHDDYSAPNPY